MVSGIGGQPPKINTGETSPTRDSPSQISSVEIKRLTPYIEIIQKNKVISRDLSPEQFISNVCTGNGSPTLESNYLGVLCMANTMFTQLQSDVTNGNWIGAQTISNDDLWYLVSGNPNVKMPSSFTPHKDIYMSPHGFNLLGNANMNYNFQGGYSDPNDSGDISAQACIDIENTIYQIIGLKPTLCTLDQPEALYRVGVTPIANPNPVTAWGSDSFPPSADVQAQMNSDISSIIDNLRTAISNC